MEHDMSENSGEMIPVERIAHAIYLIRGEKVILDEDLARMYGVSTRALNQAVKRHGNRFPGDFMFLLTRQEFTDLKSQSVTSRWGGRRKLPRAFTELGVAMLSSVLTSETAVEVNMLIMRAFVRLRKVLAEDEALARRVDELSQRVAGNEQAIAGLFAEIDALTDPGEGEDEEPKERMGFRRRGE